MNPATAPVERLLPLPVLLCLLGAGATLVLGRRPRLQRLVSLGVLTAVVGVSVALLVAATSGPLVTTLGSWPQPLGITLVADGLSTIMLVASMTVTLLVLVYAVGQGSGDDAERTPVSIFHPTYLVLAAGVADAFLAGDLFNLYVGVEVLLMASYVLLTLGGTRSRVRAGLTYVVVNVVSSLIFLSAIATVYAAVGTLNLADVAMRMDAVSPGVARSIHLLLLVAFGIKAALFPLSAWLPDSYPTAAAPVTAVFAGLLTKVGVYAILRTQTLLFPGDELVRDLLTGAALVTMILGALGAIAQDDIKRVLSFTLVSHIGYMIFGVALASPAGVGAAVFYVVHHITVQAALFCVAGLVEQVAGSTSLRHLGGLAAASPVLAALYLVPALNLGGIPPLSGFLGKLGLVVAGLADGSVPAVVLVAGALLTSLLTLYVMAKVWVLAFWRPRDQVPTASPDDPDSDDADSDDPDSDDPDSDDPDSGDPDSGDADSGDADSGGGGDRPDPDRYPVMTGATAAGSPAGSPHELSGALGGGVPPAARAPAPTPEAVAAGERPRLPPLMTAASVALAGLGLAVTLLAGPLYGLTRQAGAELTARNPYLSAVDPAGRPPGVPR